MSTIGHFVRTWLRPTETFIWGPIAHHTRHRPVVLARDLLPGAPHEGVPIHAASRALAGPAKRWSDVRYRTFRGLAGAERRFYARTLQQTGCDLVHAQFATDARYVLPAARAAGLPLVTTVHGYDYSRFPRSYGGLGRHYLRPLFRHGAQFIAVAGAVRDALVALGCPAERITVSTFGIDTERFAPVARDPAGAGCVFLMVSGFTGKKGVDVALRAFARARAALPDARLVLVGTGPERPAAEALAAALGLGAFVDFRGFVPHDTLPDLYRHSHVFVHPSQTTEDGDREGIPTVLMEALASGVPVISTVHAGIPELVRDGENGFLVPERDAAALAARMGTLAGDPALRARLACAGRARVVADFNVRTQTQRLENLYDTVLARTRPHAAGAPA